MNSIYSIKNFQYPEGIFSMIEKYINSYLLLVFVCRLYNNFSKICTGQLLGKFCQINICEASNPKYNSFKKFNFTDL